MLTPEDAREARYSGALELRNKGLTSVPPEVFDISGLRQLDLSGNQIADLPPDIAKLTRLEVLHLKGNRLTTVPAELKTLDKLRVLDLNDNEIRSLPKELSELRKLHTLLLARNQLNVLPRVVPEFGNLETLWLEDNQLTHLPEGIGRLRRLKYLRLDRNRLTAVPREIGSLGKLVTLLCEDNALTELPEELRYLAALHQLRLDGNQLTEFPAALTELNDLRTLSVARNQITSLPGALGKQLRGRLKVDLADNPLREPLPTLIARGGDDLAAYLDDLDSVGEQFFEAKVMVLGEGFVGKTSLVAALREEAFQERRPPTPGIAVSLYPLPYPDRPDTFLTLRLWDFGGQDDYLVTHQLFVSRRAVYLVVWNMRQGLESRTSPGGCARSRSALVLRRPTAASGC